MCIVTHIHTLTVPHVQCSVKMVVEVFQDMCMMTSNDNALVVDHSPKATFKHILLSYVAMYICGIATLIFAIFV